MIFDNARHGRGHEAIGEITGKEMRVFVEKKPAVFAMAVLLGSLLLGSCETQTAKPPDRALATKTLPEGFEPVGGTAIHATGYPMEICCKKDGAIMVFVPAGEFVSGLTDDQVEVLAEMIAPYETLTAEEASWYRELLLDELKPGKLLTAEDLKDLDKLNGDVLSALMLLGVLQDEGVDVPHQDLEQWREQGRTLDSLLAIPTVYDSLLEDKIQAVQAFARDTETDKLLTSCEPQPGKLLTEADLHEFDKQSADQQAAIVVLDFLQRDSADIPAEDLKRWRNGGRTLAGLLAIPAVPEGLLQSDLRMMKDLQSDLQMLKDFRDQPTEEIRLELREEFPKARRVRTGAFYIDKYEVTNRQYRVFFEQANDPERQPGIWYGARYLWEEPSKLYDLWDDNARNADDQPVTCVGEEDVLAYAQWSGKRLPTREEWQHAALGDGNRLFPWGDDFTQDICKCRVNSSEAKGRSASALVRVGESTIRMFEAEQKSVKMWEALRIAANLPAAARELRTMLPELETIVSDGPQPYAAVPAAVGSFPKDVSPFDCFDLGGNVSEWVVLKSQGEGRAPQYIQIGGNANSWSLQYLVPAQERSYTELGKLVGFRTVLPLDESHPPTASD